MKELFSLPWMVVAIAFILSKVLYIVTGRDYATKWNVAYDTSYAVKFVVWSTLALFWYMVVLVVYYINNDITEVTDQTPGLTFCVYLFCAMLTSGWYWLIESCRRGIFDEFIRIKKK